MQEFSALDGAILIDKPSGPTSHDVVDAIRRHFNLKKVGHCGTLDPNATGLLIIVLGRGTKLSEKLMSDDKVYEGAIKFGETTNSYDSDGDLIASLPVPVLTLDQLNEAAAPFIGDDDAERNLGQHKRGDNPVQGTRGYGVGRWPTGILD